MAKKDKQEFVTQITPRSEDFSQRYTDVILKTDLCLLYTSDAADEL